MPYFVEIVEVAIHVLVTSFATFVVVATIVAVNDVDVVSLTANDAVDLHYL